jgi:microcystin-dependent protein
MTASSTLPSNGLWLWCDGSVVSRTTYANLFTAIGTSFNLPTGETATTSQFRLPDLRGCVVVGVDGTAGRLAANDALGNRGGSEKYTLVQANLPEAGATYTLRSNNVSGGVPVANLNQGEDHVRRGGVNSAVSDFSLGGADQPFSIMQPYQVLNYIIHI